MAFKCLFLVFFLNLSLFNAIAYQILGGSTEKIKVPGRTPYNVYWNVPTFQCSSHKINFTILTEKYNICHNDDDKFIGDVMTILYDPGAFPAILTSKSYSKVVLRNGGVPQEGNLTLHLNYFREKIEQQIPNKNFSGIGIIDFESWRPIFRQNFGTLTPYKDFSIEIEKQLHPFWPENFIEKEAKRRFEFHGRMFMEETLICAKKLRPNGTWGYYAYPYCFNSPNNMRTHCSLDVQKENDMLGWLFKESDTLNPSLYLQQESLNAKQRQQLITGRITEAHRVRNNINKSKDPLILPYFWYKYQDTNKFVSKDDVYDSLQNLKRLKSDGLIIWGSSNDVNSKSSCEELYKYVDTILGPALNAV